jgi:hypothetical protein
LDVLLLLGYREWVWNDTISAENIPDMHLRIEASNGRASQDKNESCGNRQEFMKICRLLDI